MAEIRVEYEHARSKAAKRLFGLADRAGVPDQLDLVARGTQLRDRGVAARYEHSRPHVARVRGRWREGTPQAGTVPWPTDCGKTLSGGGVLPDGERSELSNH
jgi:hypothetical protein